MIPALTYILACLATLFTATAYANEESRIRELAKDAHRTALVFGNSDYTQLTRLKNPGRDASLISDRLRQAGFEVIKVTDRTLQEMSRDIDEFVRRAKSHGPETVTVLFYAGHGLESDAVNYLIPIDAKIQKKTDIGNQALSVESIAKKLSTVNNQLNILIVDACRDNPFPNTMTSQSTLGLVPMGAIPGVFIASSTGSGSAAFDGDGNNSIYTMRLAEALEMPGERLEDVFKRVRRHVRIDTAGQQIPWESTSIELDFYFLAPPPKPAASAQLFQAAKETKNVALLDLLIERFPESAEANEAKALRSALEAKRQDSTESAPDLVLERARKIGDLAAFDLVVSLFPGTPQAEIALEQSSKLREANVLASSGQDYVGRELVFHLTEEMARLGCINGPRHEFDETVVKSLRRAAILTDDHFLWHKPTMAAVRALRKVSAKDGCSTNKLSEKPTCVSAAGDTLCP